MDPTRSCLSELIEPLRRYKAPSPPDDDDDDDAEDHRNNTGAGGGDVDEKGMVFSYVGLPESVLTPPQRFRPKRAAVLLCLFEGDAGEIRIILTKRSSNLSTHPGEICMPGGKVEDGDKDDADTATREAKEEIGLDPSLVTVVAVLEPFLSRHLLRVVPVIGILSDKKLFKPIANVSEVETIFDAPLEMFLKDQNRKSAEREWMGEKFLAHSFDFETGNEKFVIHGLTATILIHAASLVYQRPPSFPEQKPKFRVPRNLMGQHQMPF